MKISNAAAIVAFSYATIGAVVHADEQQRQTCTSDDDCAGATVEDGPGDYCSTVDQTCLAAGDCTVLEDCTDNMSNIFAVPMCMGTMYCIEDAGNPGRCVNICMGTPSACDAFDACGADGAGLEGDCCPNEEGKFLACCAGVTLAPTTTVPENRPNGDAALCSLYSSCLADGMTAEVGGETLCCPDENGDMLECCSSSADDGQGVVDSPAEDDSLMNEMMMGVDDAVVPGTLPEADPDKGGGDNPDSPVVGDDSPADGDGDVDMDVDASVPPVTMPADPATASVEGVEEGKDAVNLDTDAINTEEIGGNNCESKVSCRDCLDDDTTTCGWVPAVEGCLESCNIIADASCYNIQSFNSDNNNNNMMTGDDICVVAENDLADMNVCKSRTDCTSCVETNLISDTSSWNTCQWFQDGNYCSSGCGMNGCGETICSTDSGDDGQEMIEMVGDDPIPSLCVEDRDCNTSPDSEDLYCATGTCLPQGGCFVDTDCVNPSNYGIKDTKCVGYLFCDTSVNLCDRKCTGFDCPGEVPATECSVTGCDTRIACPGSVNCVVDQCDANCKGIFFDSSGMVLEECTGGKGFGDSDEQTPPEQEKGGEGVSMVGEPLLQTMPPTPVDVDADASMPPTPVDVDVDAASAAGSSTADSTSPATDVTTTADDATTDTADDVGTPASAATIATSDTAEAAAAAAASSATVSILRRGHNFLSVSLLCTIVVGAMTGLVVGII